MLPWLSFSSTAVTVAVAALRHDWLGAAAWFQGVVGALGAACGLALCMVPTPTSAVPRSLTNWIGALLIGRAAIVWGLLALVWAFIAPALAWAGVLVVRLAIAIFQGLGIPH
jgi:hypothetical protein